MTLTAANTFAFHDRSLEAYTTERDAYAAQGFRTVSLCLYGGTDAPRFAGVMVRRPHVIATRSFPNLTGAQLQATFEDMAKQGLGPYIISATGTAGDPRFAIVFREMAATPLTRSNLSRDEFADLNIEQHSAGAILLWADVFGSATDPRYCAIWAPNPDRVAWNVDAADDGGTPLQQRFEAMATTLARPALVSVAPDGGLLELFVDSRVDGTWTARAGMSSEAYQQEVQDQVAEGRWPVCVSAASVNQVDCFAAVFASAEEVLPRTVRSSGPTEIEAVDQAVTAFVRDHNLRGAALAVLQGTRLVYARGYTYAEPDYPDVQPTTYFRMASVSKLYTAAAVWKLVERGDLRLDQTMQSVLGLTQPDGSPPHVDPANPSWTYDRITISHLLESVSGINQGGVWGCVEASAAAHGSLPSDSWEVARWITSLPLTGIPGNTKNAVYGNTDYFLLGLVCAKKLGVDTFEDALEQLVLTPLGMSRTRSSRSLVGKQPADEARYHLSVHDHDPDDGWKLRQLDVLPSVKTPDRPLVASQYGSIDYGIFDGCGGLSASVVDVARLAAMLASHVHNPLLRRATIERWLAAAVEATKTNWVWERQKDGHWELVRSHGYHGLDWAVEEDAATLRYLVGKGGWLPGMGSVLYGSLGDLVYVIAYNGNARPDVPTNWLPLVQQAMAGRSWPSGDLFASEYGMSSLLGDLVIRGVPVPSPRGRAAVGTPALAQPVDATVNRVRRSMEATRTFLAEVVTPAKP